MTSLTSIPPLFLDPHDLYHSCLHADADWSCPALAGFMAVPGGTYEGKYTWKTGGMYLYYLKSQTSSKLRLLVLAINWTARISCLLQRQAAEKDVRLARR